MNNSNMAAGYFTFLVLALFSVVSCEKPVDYSGHKVITVLPKTTDELKILERFRTDYGVDLWNEPSQVNRSVMMRLEPKLVDSVETFIVKKKMEYYTAFENLQSVIDEEKIHHSPKNVSYSASANSFDFGKYHMLSEVLSFVQQIQTNHPNLAKVEVVGNSYQNRPIHVVKITSGGFGSKPVIMIECGIHAREWSSVAAGLYLMDQLLTGYGSDSEITAMLDKYEFNIIPEANPDGYLFTWQVDRLWRKTRSRSNLDWLGNCPGADANRNYDIEHCGIGSSRKPCDDTYCGDAPFSESETRAVRDLMDSIGSRMAMYISLHAFSQYWMTPYGMTKKLPQDYNEHVRVGTAGVQAIAKKYGTAFKLGSIANIIYEAAGSSVDYAYEVKKIKMSFALELRDTGRYGFFLPQQYILPCCEETFDGLKAAVQALR